jgi:hypothetical protein
MILSIPKEEIEEAMTNRHKCFPSITESNRLVQELTNPVQSFITEHIMRFDKLETTPLLGKIALDRQMPLYKYPNEMLFVYPGSWGPESKFYLNSYYDIQNLYRIYNDALLYDQLPCEELNADKCIKDSSKVKN